MDLLNFLSLPYTPCYSVSDVQRRCDFTDASRRLATLNTDVEFSCICINIMSSKDKSNAILPVLEEDDADDEEEEIRECESTSETAENEEKNTEDDINEEEEEEIFIIKKPAKVEEIDPETDLELEDEKSEFDSTMKGVYLCACKRLGVIPCSYFMRHMFDREIKLRHHGLGKLGAEAISWPLQTNTTTLSIDLHDNWLEGEGGAAISEMLLENCYISEIDLSDNRLGSKGVTAICKMLMQNTVIQTLNLSGNGISDHDAQVMADAVNENNRIKYLNLSRNEFSEKAGAILGPAFYENETIEHLDLSWNHFRRSSAIKLCEGIAENMGLKRVNLAMNGFDDDVAFSVAEILQKNQTILELDVSYNRFGLAGAMVISKALENNDVLLCLRIGNTRIGVEGAKILLKAISSSNSVVTEMNLSGVEVDKEFLALKKELSNIRPVKVIHASTLSNFIIKKRMKSEGDALFFDWPKDEVNPANIIDLVKKFCDKNNIEVKELFEEKCDLKQRKIDISGFLSCLQTGGLVLSESQSNLLNILLEECADDNLIDIACFLDE